MEIHLIEGYMFTMFHWAIGALAVCLMSLYGTLPAWAQCDSSFQFYPPDARIYPTTADGPDTSHPIDPRIYTAQWHFETQSDSTTTHIIVDDFIGNGRRIWMHNWCRDKVWNWNKVTKQYFVEISNAGMSEMSRTSYMPIVAGDTIGFFRCIYWGSRSATEPRFRYVSDDVVSYSAELVRQTTGQRLALLDTFRISQNGASTPCFHARYPLASKVRYVIPSHITDTIHACIRINVHTNGASNDTFSRSDVFSTARVRLFLDNAYFENFMSTVNTENACGASPVNCGVTIANGTAGTINAMISSNTVALVKAYSQQGLPVAEAAITSWPSTKTLTTNSGLFMVCGLDDTGTIICTSMVMVP